MISVEQGRFSLFAKTILYLGIGLVLNQLAQFVWPGQAVKPDSFFVLSWTFAYFYESRLRLPLTLACGLFRDWLYSPILGLSLSICLLTSYLAGHLLQLIWQRKVYYLPVQIAILSLIARFFESILLRFNLFFQYKVPVTLPSLVNAFSLDLPRIILLNILVSLIYCIVLTRFYPFSRLDKEVYAEDLIRP